MNMTITTREDSLLFASAEMRYMEAAYAKAAEELNTYISQYCAGGRYCTTALYYLADSYYRLGKSDEALAQYSRLADISANPYQEEAVIRMAGIHFDHRDYEAALEAFYRMEAMASTRENTVMARLGILRCAALLERHTLTVDISSQLLNDPLISDDIRSEALYTRAKAYMAQRAWNEAQADLRTLSGEVRTAQGAEAKYLLAQSMYEQGRMDEAEAEVMNFTRMSTSQQYWLARALILLSDIYATRGETFQARQYLLALQQNYTLSGDDIPTLIAGRMATLDKIEQPVVINDNEEDE
jgi:TolA-binding protein